MNGKLQYLSTGPRLLVAMLVLATVSMGACILLIQSTADRSVSRQAEEISLDWARVIVGRLPSLANIAAGGAVSEQEAGFLRDVTKFGQVFRFKLFSPDGQLRLTSDELVTGHRALGESLGAHNAKAHGVIATLRPFTQLQDGTEKPDRPDVYVESYVPVVHDGKLVAISEVYVDQTEAAAAIQSEFIGFGGRIAGIIVLLLLVPGIAIRSILLQLTRRNAELAIETDRAKQADRAKSEYLANMSHEIRTPLNGMMGMAELLQQTTLDARQQRYADTVSSSGQGLLTIINDILDFSKMDAGQLQLSQAPFRLSRAISDVATLMSAQAQEKGLELVIRIDPDMPRTVVGDVGRIRQILTNLIGNALKFTDSGHVLIDVRATVDHESGDPACVCVELRVSDTGIGMNADQTCVIFEKFSQVDGSATRRQGGTGLGLAIVRMLVTEMKGKIEVESEVGTGSTFTVTLPLPIDGDLVERKIVPVSVDGKHVLIIDDNALNREILVEQLTSWGLVPHAESSGLAGLGELARAMSGGLTYDLVILDYNMPGMDGAGVARTLRGTTSLSQIPILMLTSVEQPDCGGHFLDMGVDGHLVKPANASLLHDQLVTILSRSATDASIAGPALPVELTGATNENQQATTGESDTHTDALPVPDMPADEKMANSGLERLVLVAEDNAVNQELAIGILMIAGCKAIIANNGEEAIAAFVKKRPMLILMDVSMPVMGGHAATVAIRELEHRNGWDRTPILGLTAHAQADDRDRCIKAGMDDYMSKPLSVDGLVAKIEAMTAKQEPVPGLLQIG